MKKNTVLMYHSVTDEGGKYPYTVSVDNFRRQMKWLYDNNIKVQTLDETIRQKESGTINEDISVTITFDDGFLDNYTYALPVLEEFDFKATFFIVTGHVGKYNSWDLKKYADKRLMTWQHIDEIAQKGHIIGCHTHNHYNLANTASETIVEDLEKSFNLLKQRIKSSFIPLAYPYGAYTCETVKILQKMGFPGAVRISRGYIERGSETPFEISRFDVDSYVTQNHFEAEINHKKTGFPVIKWLEKVYLFFKMAYCNYRKGTLW